MKGVEWAFVLKTITIKMSNPHYQYNDVGAYGSKSPITALTTRFVTLISLAVSIAVLVAYDEKLDNGYVLTYKDFRSYK